MTRRAVVTNGHKIGIQDANHSEAIFYIECRYDLPLHEFGIAEVISANATAGDVNEYRKETAWVINDITTSGDFLPIGIHTYFSKGQTQIAVSYSVKGIKR